MTKVCVELENLSAVDKTWVLIGVSGSIRNVSSRIVVRKLSKINLILQSNLNSITSKCCRAGGDAFGIYTTNACSQKVGLSQVEQGGESDSHDRCGRIDLCFAGDQLANIVIISAVDVRISCRQARDGDVVGQ